MIAQVAVNKLTGKQEVFSLEWHKTGNKSASYRKAYPTSLKWNENSVNSAAVKLSKIPKVLQRFNELKSKSARRNQADVDLLDKMHKSAFQMAKETKNPNAMTTAAKNLGDLHGLNINKKKLTTDDGEGGEAPFGNGPVLILPLEQVEDEN